MIAVYVAGCCGAIVRAEEIPRPTCPGCGKAGGKLEEHLGTVLLEVALERERQDRKFGPLERLLDMPDGTGRPWDMERAITARKLVDRNAAAGRVTHREVLEEEIAEAFAERGGADLRAELLQIAAYCVKWAQVLDLRELRRRDTHLEAIELLPERKGRGHADQA